MVNLLYDSSSVDILQIVDSISVIIAPRLDFLNKKIKLAQDDNLVDSVGIFSRQLRLFTIVDGYCQSIKLFLPVMEDSADFDNDTQYDLEDIFLGYGKALPGYMPGLMEGIHSLKQFYKLTDLKKEWLTLSTLSEKLRTVQNNFRLHSKRIEIPVAERNARPNVDYVGKVLGVLFKELNILSVSPFAMLDAARLRIRKGEGGNGFQRGAGAGIRLSLINFDIYAGYSFNVNRQVNDKKGAFVGHNRYQ